MSIPAGETYQFTSIPTGAAVLGLPGGSFVLSVASNMAVGNYNLAWRRSSGVTGTKAFSVV